MLAKFVLRRALAGLLVLAAVTLVAFWAQDVALRSRLNQPAPAGEVLREVVRDSVDLWRRIPSGDLGAYTTPTGAFRSDRAQPLGDLLPALLARSLALLLLAMVLGGLVGGLVGVLSAATRRRGVSLALILLSIVGISTPSFFLAMLLQIGEISIYRLTGGSLLPVGGFGWDSHLVLPVLVLAARPIAQVARLTHVQVADIIEQDFVRTAHSKGLMPRRVWMAHILRNVANSVLTAMGTSLRFSLSSLPVVEMVFGWPGAGKALLDMLQTSQRVGATVLVLSMGALFVLINMLLDVAYRMIDPRLRELETGQRTDMTWWEWLVGLFSDLGGVLTLARWRTRRQAQRETLALALPRTEAQADEAADEAESGASRRASSRRDARWRIWQEATVGNPALVFGALIACVLLVLVIAGPSLARHNAYTSQPTLLVDGELVRPPIGPTDTYPLGTDGQGRDILSLLLVGARRTLTIAFLAMLARLLIGGTLGFLAGWFSGSRLDRAIMSLTETVSAFPSLLLAMLVVYAVGIQQGVVAFVAALAVIGWGEVMQTVRAQVMRIKPMEYIEGAVATGLSPGQILSAHVLPNVWPTMMSLSFLEMGGVLMILGELGFLGVFIGGGLGADGEYGLPTLVYYDIPEWSVMLANSWRSFRSYPWATLYPGLAFFVSILGFTLLGEGLRWLTEKLTLSFKGLFNRYTFAAVVLVFGGLTWTLNSTGVYSAFVAPAQSFNTGRAVEDTRTLSEEFNGRLSGTADADAAAQWIADEFRRLGLQPAGETVESYFQSFGDYSRVLNAVPSLHLTGPDGESLDLVYGQDFYANVGSFDIGGSADGEIVVISGGTQFYWMEGQAAEAFDIPIAEVRRSDRIVLRLTPQSFNAATNLSYIGLMTLDQGQIAEQRYEMLARAEKASGLAAPSVWIAPSMVEHLIAGTGFDLETLLAQTRENRTLYLRTGWHARMDMPTNYRQAVPVRNVIAFWPGKDMLLDSDMIIVAAHYDGLGRFPAGDPAGVLYPGANDNASGVAAMLEMVRTLKERQFVPKRTILFVAWTGREFHTRADWDYFLQARLGFSEAYKVVAAIEMEGVGAGSGDAAVMWHTSSERLTEVLRKSASRIKTPLTTRNAGLHADATLWSAPAPALPAATISWAGADAVAHTPEDDIEHIDPEKLGAVGRLVSLAVMVLASDPAY